MKHRSALKIQFGNRLVLDSVNAVLRVRSEQLRVSRYLILDYVAPSVIRGRRSELC